MLVEGYTYIHPKVGSNEYPLNMYKKAEPFLTPPWFFDKLIGTHEVGKQYIKNPSS